MSKLKFRDAQNNFIEIQQKIDATNKLPASNISGLSYIHEQDVAMNTWTIQHNLNKMPSVTVVDNNNNIVDGAVEYIDANNITIRFNATFRGKAYLN